MFTVLLNKIVPCFLMLVVIGFFTPQHEYPQFFCSGKVVKHPMNLQGPKVRRTRIYGAGLGVHQLGVPLPHAKGCYHLVAGLWFTVQCVG